MKQKLVGKFSENNRVETNRYFYWRVGNKIYGRRKDDPKKEWRVVKVLKEGECQ